MKPSNSIREARERMGISQEILAERMGVSRQAVSKWEVGAAAPTPENLQRLSQILGEPVCPESSPAKRSGRWKPWYLICAALLLTALAAGVLFLRKPQETAPSISAVAFFDLDGTPLRPSLGDGWYRFTPGSQILMAVSYQDSADTPVFAVSLFLTPSGTETYDERKQLAVQAVEQNGGIALFLLNVPTQWMDHLDITLECAGGQTVMETLNVTTES